MASKHQVGAYQAMVAAGCFAAGMAVGYFGVRVDRYAYDWISVRSPVEQTAPQSVVVAIDEATLEAKHGMRNIRSILAEALGKIAAAHPKVVALDVTLPEEADPEEDARLEAALRATPGLILPCQVVGAKWEDPAPRFQSIAVALGHVHHDLNPTDGVSRRVSLEIAMAGKRRWALALEAFRVARGEPIVESPEDVQVGSTLIPAARTTAEGGVARPMLVRYLPPGRIQSIPVLDLDMRSGELRDKTVFVGVTALSAARDRLLNSFNENVPGVEVHAHVFETLARGKFLTNARDTTVFVVCATIAAAAGLTFAYFSGWLAYALSVALIALATWLPFEMFRHGVVLPFVAPVAVAWLSTAGAAIYQHFFVRRQLVRSESEKSRYQQAIHWAAHEMRTPLTAIQGSSEIMSRYNLTEEKRHQLSGMINSESKRLSRVIQTFLDVERLAEGQVELKREVFPANVLVQACLERVTPLAERKQIALSLDTPVNGTLVGDRELMEYALYNLLTNAVKYSPANTQVRVTSELDGDELRLAVRDQGIGMDAKELKSIFQKFYRTKRAEASGEVGTGIGLSIVEEIVTHHGGRIDVTSAPGKGSCFTMVLRAQPA